MKERPGSARNVARWKVERDKLSVELMRDHQGKPAQWVRTRLNRIDWLTKQIHLGQRGES